MQYPLLFPYGEDGYRTRIMHRDKQQKDDNSKERDKLTMREFFAFRMQDRRCEVATILLARRLLQQFIVDGYTMIEVERLFFVKNNQQTLRADNVKNLRGAVSRGDTEGSSTGSRIVLPASFTGGHSYMRENYQDAMAICRWYGYPDLFITFTCNPKWPEITRFVNKRGIRPEDRPDIICRVFKMKLDQMVKDLKDRKIFGRVRSVVYTVEFQKRGLPHAHILLFLHHDDKFPDAEAINKIICAEIPIKHENLELYEAVKEYMMHGPCGVANLRSPCMKDKKCMKHFPKKYNVKTTVDEEGYPVYKRSDNGTKVEKNGVELDNRFVVPYNPYLLLKYRAHINVEWCNQSRSIKYLFKYINKGYDRVTAAAYQNRENTDDPEQIDEIKMYYDCRTPPVERLSFHLPDEHTVVFSDETDVEAILDRPNIDKTKFLSWMECNKTYAEARDLSYVEFPTRFVWKQDKREWTPRSKGFAIGLIYHVTPGCGEKYYLRTLLNFVRGATSYEDIRRVNGVLYPTFKEACYARGLLDDDKEYVDAITEASFRESGRYLRNLFCMLLLSGSLSKPEEIWNKTWHLLSDDILYRQRMIHQDKDLQLSEEQIQAFALAEIEERLQSNGSSLRRFREMPFPDELIISEGENRLIADEMAYDRDALHDEHKKLFTNLTNEQSTIYNEIMDAVSRGNGGVFFVYGYGGTGKTYIWRTLCAALRSKGEIVLPVASSGIASLLLPRGRTAHSRFGLPINVSKNSTCVDIRPGTDLAALLIKAQLIIWDEAPMMHKHCFEALDRSLKDIMQTTDASNLYRPFGGKVVVFGGDYTQILPVIPKGSRQDIVFAALNSSYLWDACKVLQLTQNMRLQGGGSPSSITETREFSEWLLEVGDGKAGDPNDGGAEIGLPDDIVIDGGNDPILAIVESTYPCLQEHLWEATYFQDRAILAPTHDIVEMVNDHVLANLPGEERLYLSSYSGNKEEGNLGVHEIYSTEFLNTIKCSGLPNHSLRLKVGTPVMLIRNIDQTSGLCNGTRLVIKHLGNRVVKELSSPVATLEIRSSFHV